MYVIRYRDLKNAIDPSRKMIKLSDYNLWKLAWPEGTENWQEGNEIRSNAIGISLFTTGTREKPHYHERTWELYQVLEGSLKIILKRYRVDSWTEIVLNRFDMLLMAPGTIHLVDPSCQHITQVIQSPPALSDKVLIDDKQEIKAVNEVLKNSKQHY